MPKASTWRSRALVLLGLGICIALYASFGAAGRASIADAQETVAQETVRSDEPTLPDSPFAYANPDLPNHFNAPPIRNANNTPQNNPITDAGATLGRVLFYDGKLSANDTIACASCHIQANGFSDNRKLSVGFEGGLTGRSSMGLSNARYYNRGAFFWDERATTLEHQVLMPIQDGVEMGMELAALETKLAGTSYYPALFAAAYGSEEVTSERVSLALAQFVRSLVSGGSKYDAGVGTNFANFTPQEAQGRNIFNSPPANCNVCHRTDIQILDRPRNNGLDATTVDAGVGGITGNAADDAVFKSPSLRNVELRAPYMHDGRFATLEEVVSFYNNGVQNHPNLDQALRGRNGAPRRLNLNAEEQAALVAFLKTLTDTGFVADPKFSDPFAASTEPENTPTPTASATATASVTATASATATHTPTATGTSTATATATSTPTASATPTATGTPTGTATATVTPSPVATDVAAKTEYRLMLPMVGR